MTMSLFPKVYCHIVIETINLRLCALSLFALSHMFDYKGFLFCDPDGF